MEQENENETMSPDNEHARGAQRTEPCQAWRSVLVFHAQEVQRSELGAEAQGSEMSRALPAQTPGATQSSTGLKGTETHSGKSPSMEGAVRTYRLIDSAQLRTVRCILRQTLSYEVANYFNQILHFPKSLLYSFLFLSLIYKTQTVLGGK